MKKFSRREKTFFWLFAGLAVSAVFVKGYYAPFLRESRLAVEKYDILQRKIRRWEEDILMVENIKERSPQWAGNYVTENGDLFSEQTRRILQEGARHAGLFLQHIDIQQKTGDPFSRITAHVQVKGMFPPMARFFGFLQHEAPFLDIDEVSLSRPSYAQDSLVCEMRISRTFFTGGRQ